VTFAVGGREVLDKQDSGEEGILSSRKRRRKKRIRKECNTVTKCRMEK